MAGLKRLEPWELFVARLREEDAGEVVVTAAKRQRGDAAYTATAGSTTREHRDGRVLAVEVPTQENATARTIRLHESLHARVVPLPFDDATPDWVQQAIEDAHLHTTEWPEGIPQSVERDAAAATLREVRAISRTLASLPPLVREALPKSVRQAVLTCLTRDLAMLDTAQERLGELGGEWREHLEAVVPREVLEGAATAGRLVRAGQWRKACALLQEALDPAPQPKKEEGGNAEGEGEGERSPRPTARSSGGGGVPGEPSEAKAPPARPTPAPPKTAPPATAPPAPEKPKAPAPLPRNRELEEQAERERQQEFQEALTESVAKAPQLLETLAKVAPQMVEMVPHSALGLQLALAAGQRKPNIMEIVELEPRVEPVKLGRGRKLLKAASGMRVRVAGVAQAYASGNAYGLFKRKRFTQSVAGSILIDASGSMGLTSEALEELVRAAPGAIIAYYTGIDDRGGGGSLYVAARNGKLFRPKPGKALPRCGGGNDVDEKALLWLLRQKAPRVFVTDCGFCGGDEGQAMRARLLLHAALTARKLLWFQGLHEALDGFAKLVREAALHR